MLERAGRAPQRASKAHVLVASAPLLLLATLAYAVDAPAVSAWVESGHSSARLIAGGPAKPPFAAGGALWAGVEIRLDPATITYWRNPGEAGVAPVFDTLHSDNVASVTIDFPAPKKIDEAGSVAFGYEGGVIIPLRVLPDDPARPATLKLDLDYAVCAVQCLPAKAHLELLLAGQGTAETISRLAEAVALVPREASLGAPGALSILGVARTGPADRAAFEVAARAAPSAELFVESPEGWYVEAGKAKPHGANAVTFPLEVLQRPEGRDPADLRVKLTLVDGARAIAVAAPLGTVAPSR